MRTKMNWIGILVVLLIVIGAGGAVALDMSLEIGGSRVPATWVNDQISEYGVEHHEALLPIEYAFSGRIGLRIPEWSFWRASTTFGLDLRMSSRASEGGHFSADLLGLSAGTCILFGRLAPTIDAVVYRASYSAPERVAQSLSGWGLGFRFGISYRQPISSKLSVTIGAQGDIARIDLNGGDRASGADNGTLDFSGVGLSIGIVWGGW